MAYDSKLADRIREYLVLIPGISIAEKKMFSGVSFMVNGKMCINVSHDNLMCRFDPAMTEMLSGKTGFEPMIMRGKEMKGYCYVTPDGFKRKTDFDYWMKTCLDFNAYAKASPKKKTGKTKKG